MSRYPDPHKVDPIPDSPYEKNSGADQYWRMGYSDGLDNDPCFGNKNGSYSAGFRAGRSHAEKFSQ